MCGRYSLGIPHKITQRFGVKDRSDTLKPRFNIAPGQKCPVITKDKVNYLEMMKWGLVPAWAKKSKVEFSNINARAESITEKVVYRKPFKRQRCLVPVDGFYEWQKGEDGKVPYYIHREDSGLFALAGVYDNNTFSIVTTSPNPLLKPIHHRMPVILNRKDEETWLDTSVDDTKEVLELLKPYSQDDLETYEVSRKVNSPRNDFPEVTKKVA